jgi:hypothetical protein
MPVFYLILSALFLTWEVLSPAPVHAQVIDYASYGLPEPVAETKTTIIEDPDIPGKKTQFRVTGYNDLLNQLRKSVDASWATQALLSAEKVYAPINPNFKPYLTTAWIWFENGESHWPDPYAINCNDNRAGFKSDVSFICSVTNFQIAGYQAASRKNDYMTMFKNLIKNKPLKNVIKDVIDNSSHTPRQSWSYVQQRNTPLLNKYLYPYFASSNDASKLDVTENDISPNSDFFNEKTQFFTLLLGKDPMMAIALNSFAVRDGDLIKALKTKECAYGYICAKDKQRLANMVEALRLFTFDPNFESGPMCPAPTSNPAEPSTSQWTANMLVDKIQQNCIEGSTPGRVTQRNAGCLGFIQPALSSLALNVMKKDAETIQCFTASVGNCLQCVGFVRGAVIQTTGSDLRCNGGSCGNAIDYWTNIPDGFKKIPNDPKNILVGDIAIFDTNKAPTKPFPQGHIGIVCSINMANGKADSFLICEGDADLRGGVTKSRVINIANPMLVGWLRKK